ncbi:hypothetical protein ACQ4PT_036911 [Festuca glaucescens]
MDVDESSKVLDSAAIPHAPDAHGSKLSVSSDVVEAPVIRVYKSRKGKGKLCTLRQKDSRIRASVCNEQGITSEMAALCSTANLNDAKKESPRRKPIPKGKSKLLNRQPTRSSPRLARQRNAATNMCMRSMPPVIELDSVSPEMSPSRVQAADSNDVFLPRGDDTGLSFVPIATIVASPVFSPGPATVPEEANIHDGSSLPEGAPSVDREGSVFFPASSLFNNVVADVRTHVPRRKDSPKNAADVEVKEQTNDIPHTGSPTVPEEANIHDASTLPEVAPVDTGVIAAPMVCNIKSAAAHSDVQPHFDREGSVFFPASSLFNNVVAGVSTHVPCRKDSPKNAADVEVKEQTTDIPHTGSPGVFVHARPLFTDKEFPLWNFTSQSLVSQPAMVCSPINAATNGGPCNPTIPLSYATIVPLAASSVCVDDIPLAIPMAGAPVAVGGTSTGVGCHAHANISSNVHSAGDLFDEFEPDGVPMLPVDVSDAHAYSTPAMNKEGNVVLSASITPKTRLRTVRVIQPSKVLLPPFSYIPTSKYQDSLYEKVIVHTFEEKKSKIKGSRILHIEPMWVNTGELAGSMKPGGELSNTVCDIAISVMQYSCLDKKGHFPHIVTKYLLDRKFDARILRKHFRKDSSYKLSHKDLLAFPVLQTLGTPIKGKKPIGHWYMLSVNMPAKRFEILDSLRGADDIGMIEHANLLVDAIKSMYRINYSDSRRQIDDFELMYIPVPKQNTCTDCRFFMLKFLELWNGSVVPAISQDQIPALRKLRRGTDRACIHCIAFSPDSKWLAVTSDKATVHVFSVNVDSPSPTPEDGDGPDALQAEAGAGAATAAPPPAVAKPNKRSSLSFLGGFLPGYFSSEWSLAQFRVREGTKHLVAFGRQPNTVLIIGMDGSFYRCRFDPEKGGDMEQLEHMNFMNLSEKMLSAPIF